MQVDPAISETVISEGVRSIQFDGWAVELLPRAPYEVNYTPEQPIVGYAFETQIGTHSFASDKRKKFQSIPNGIGWVPAGCEVYSQSSGGEYLKISYLQLPEWASNQVQRFSDVVLPKAIKPAFALRRALLNKKPIDMLECESSLMAIDASVSGATRKSNHADQSRGWMNRKRLKKIDEIIEERMDTQLTVSWLAQEFGLSAGFFSRELKRACGRSPYQYIVDKRLAKAREQLLQSNQDLSAIAFACGFSSHSHMTSQFKQRLGITPAKLRHESK